MLPVEQTIAVFGARVLKNTLPTPRRFSSRSSFSRPLRPRYYHHLPSYAVDINVLNHFSQVRKLVSAGYVLYPIEQFTDLLRSRLYSAVGSPNFSINKLSASAGVLPNATRLSS